MKPQKPGFDRMSKRVPAHVRYGRAALIGLMALTLVALAPHTVAKERPAPRPQATPVTRFVLPIGMPGKPPGDGFFIRHGYTSENTWYNPGYWHTGEDWYALEGD